MTRLASAVAVASVAALGLAVAASRHAHPAEVSPVVPHGAWNGIWVWGLVCALALYGLAVLLARGSRTRLSLVIGLSVVAQALPLLSPVLLSKDVFLYWSAGRTIATYHESPYRVTPAAHPHDVAFPFVSEEWRATSPPYGPVFVTMAAAPAAAGGSSASRATLGFRVLALLGILATLAIVARATRSPAAVALLGLNPLVAIHFAGGGHSDAWMIALIVLAVEARRSARSGAAWPVAAAFKTLPVVLLPLELARTRFRAPRRFWVALVATSIAVLSFAVAFYGPGWIKGTLVGAHVNSPLGGVHWLTEAGLRHRYAVVVGAAVFAVLYLWLLRVAWRTGRARHSLALTGLCLCTSLVRPWYALWPVALAAIEEDWLAATAAYALTAYFLLGDAVSF